VKRRAGAWRLACTCRRLGSSHREFRGGGDEGLGVGIPRALADFFDWTDFEEAAALHDGYAVGEIADERHGVGDEEIGEAVGTLEVAEQVDDLGSDGDIEGADRFVEGEEGRLEGEGAGDVDALTLAAGELVGEAGEDVRGEAYVLHEFVEAGADLIAGEAALDGERLGDDLTDAHAGIERAVGVLEDHLDAAAKDAEVALAGGEEVVFLVWAVEGDLAGGGLDEAQEEAGYGALAGAGFADEAESFAAVDGEGEIVDDARLPVLFGEVANFEEGFGCGWFEGWSGGHGWDDLNTVSESILWRWSSCGDGRSGASSLFNAGTGVSVEGFDDAAADGLRDGRSGGDRAGVEA
jgi:hypothetical protein